MTKSVTNRGVFDENGVYRPELDQPEADVLRAEVVGFMDETHLLCSLTDYGNPCGGAIYDTETGMWSEYRGAWNIPVLHDGAASVSHNAVLAGIAADKIFYLPAQF